LVGDLDYLQKVSWGSGWGEKVEAFVVVVVEPILVWISK
jgi:hypothetical protein